jgi:hypothetical protein
LGHELSEDALSWNVFVRLAVAGRLREAAQHLTGRTLRSEPSLYLWGRHIDLRYGDSAVYSELRRVRSVPEKGIRRLATEPDIMLIVPDEMLIFNPSNQNRSHTKASVQLKLKTHWNTGCRVPHIGFARWLLAEGRSETRLGSGDWSTPGSSGDRSHCWLRGKGGIRLPTWSIRFRYLPGTCISIAIWSYPQSSQANTPQRDRFLNRPRTVCNQRLAVSLRSPMCAPTLEPCHRCLRCGGVWDLASATLPRPR